MQVLKNSAVLVGALDTKPPAHQSVYALLRDQILFGELSPGQAVTIQGIATQLGAGMTPVREAIRRLSSEGALVMQENRRVTVATLTSKCVDEIEFIRKSLEPELAGRAVRNITSDALRLLRAEDDALNTAISQGSIHDYLTRNYHFHARLYALAEAPIVTEAVDRLWLRFGPSLRVVCGRHGTLNLPDKHADLLRALENADQDAAKRAIAEDVEQGMMQIRTALQDVAQVC